MRVVLHEDQELQPAVARCPLVGRQEAGDVVVLLQQRQAVDGALGGVVLPVGRAEEFDCHAVLVKTAAIHRAVMTPTNQLPGRTTERFITHLWSSSGCKSRSSNIQVLCVYNR